MELLQRLEAEPSFLYGCALLFGLVVGSFLNVVIARLPRRLEQEWRRECRAWLQPDAPPDDEPLISIVRPGSQCPQCGTAIAPWHNVPVLSWLWLRGRCAQCRTPISAQYPFVEILGGLAAVAIVWRFGLSPAAAGAVVLSWALIALTFIDLKHQLLPDAITLPLLWLGLVLSLAGVFTDPRTSIIGAAAGYLSLWAVYHAFRFLTGKEGMGYGDFKLLAVFGAWLGWQMLPQIVLLASFVGALVGTAMILMKRLDRGVPIPFGPYLAAAGWIAMFWGDAVNQSYLRLTGL